MKKNNFIKFTSISSNQLGKISGGLGRTHTICRTATNDPKYVCGDTHIKSTLDDGTLICDEVQENTCPEV